MSARVRVLSAEKYLSLIAAKTPLVTLDCSWYPAGKDGHAEYKAEHIRGARYFDFNELKTESPYPHMLPRDFPEFAAAAGRLGVRRSDHIVVYDHATYLSAPRVAWLLATFGHPNVFLLDNYRAYKQLGGEVASGESPAVEPTQYLPAGEPAPSVAPWLEFDDVLSLVESEAPVNIIDARGAERFSGAQPEPRPGVQSGHIPGSKKIPFSSVVDEHGHFKTGDELRALLAAQHVDPSKRTVILCGSGVTAVVVKTALDESLGTNAEIYDGSWAEWGQRAPAKFVVKG